MANKRSADFVKELRWMIEVENLGAKEAAARLGVTKGVVMGCASRARMRFNNKPFSMMARKKAPVAPTNAPPQLAPLPMVQALIVVAGDVEGPASIISLRHDQCRWPVGDLDAVDFRWCGVEKAAGSYCAEHHALAHLVPPPRRVTPRRSGLLA